MVKVLPTASPEEIAATWVASSGDSISSSPSPLPPSPSPAMASSFTTKPLAWSIAPKPQQAQQSSLFRIASVTKPITSVTIFSLLEQGKLNLNDKVFGPSGILGANTASLPTSNTSPMSPSITCSPTPPAAGPTTPPIPCSASIPGTRPNSSPGPSRTCRSPIRPDALGLLQFRLLRAGPRDRAGHRATLRRYVQANILAPCGITDMQIAGNKESNAPRTKWCTTASTAKTPTR